MTVTEPAVTDDAPADETPVWSPGTPLPEAYYEDAPEEPSAPAEDETSEVAETEGEPVSEAAETELADPYAEFGGRDRVAQAAALAGAFQSEIGLKQVGAEIMKALNVPPETIAAVLSGQPITAQEQAQVDDALGGLGDDDVLTVADARQMIADATAQAVEQARAIAAQERQGDAQTQMINDTVGAVLDELGVTNPELGMALCKVADEKVKAMIGGYTPENIRAGMLATHAMFAGVAEQNRVTYLADKKKAKAANAKSIGAGTAQGATPPAEPTDVAAGIAAAREYLQALGDA